MFTEQAQKEFDKRKEEILSIVNTPGFNRLVEFFEIELRGVDAALTEAKTPEEAYDLVLRRRPIKRYLNFLQNITSTNPTKGA